MEYKEKDMIVRRICNTKLYTMFDYDNTIFRVVFNDPKGDILAEADFLYKCTFDELEEDGKMFTLEQSYNILRDKKIWTDKHEKELTQLPLDIKEMQSKTSSLVFQKKQLKSIQGMIEKAKVRIQELHNTKNQLWPSTIDYMAEQAKKRFLIKNIAKITPLKEEFFEQPHFLDALAVCYYRDNIIEEKQFREIARSDPWRLIWKTAKETGSLLFSNPASEMTELQYVLVLWTFIYDFCFESTQRPDESVINDDAQFDLWYAGETERLKKEASSNKLQNLNALVGDEIYIKTDEESAKDVYNLNNPLAKNKIMARNDLIQKKGIVQEIELPDVKQDISMAINRMNAQI